MKTQPLSSPRIGINAHLLSGEAGYRRAGIHQYIAQVLRHLPPDGGDYVIFTRHTEEWLEQVGTVLRSRWPTENRLARIAWEQVAWPWLAARNQIDLLHSMAFVTPWLSRRPAVVTVFDLSFMHFPEAFPAAQRWYLTSQTARSVRRARRVIAISESGRQDVHRFFDVPLTRIDVVYPGVDAVYRPLPPEEIAAFRQRQDLADRFVLHVGTLQPRKNILALIDAFAQAASPDVMLVLVGGKGWLFEEIFSRVQALGLQDRVRFTGYVPDEDLPLWYNAASVLAFPSLYEGFGMPVVEAMACGTPVVTADSSSLPEAVGEAGLLFDPQNVAELADRLTAVLHNPDLAATMRAKGLIQAQQFNWEKAGRETAAVYRKAMTGD
jgi:glycosyltransferase involved in cell wall biosynthesis